jgi:hypothetical protein
MFPRFMMRLATVKMRQTALRILSLMEFCNMFALIR